MLRHVHFFIHQRKSEIGVDPVCGTRPARYSSPLRVVGGSEVKPGTWPWMVSLHGGSDQKFFCGGTVINPSWVLTAGHCVGGG